MNPQQIESTLKEIQVALEQVPSKEDIDGVQGKLMELTGYLGTSAELIYHARKQALHKQQKVISVNAGGGHSPMILKQLVESEMWEELAIVDYADRINKAVTHAIDGYRTIVSLYGKEIETNHKANKFQV